MNTGATAIPRELVVAVLIPPAKVPLAPLAGAVKVTTTPLTGLLPASRTSATIGTAKAELIAAACGVPPVAVTEAAGPAVFVSAKPAGVAEPVVAETV